MPSLRMPPLQQHAARIIHERSRKASARSASAAAADQRASLSAGFNAFVAKPIFREALLAEVHGCRSRRVDPGRAA